MLRIQFKKYITRRLITKIAELYKTNIKTKLIKKKKKFSIKI